MTIRSDSIKTKKTACILCSINCGLEVQVGIAPNKLTSTEAKDFFAGTPWNKFVPARIEKVG